MTLQVPPKLKSFTKKLLNLSDPQGQSIRLTVDTDGQMFICRLPELSLSATEPTIGEAYENLRRQIRKADFSFIGTTDKEIFSEISSIQSISVFNRAVTKKAVIFLAISILLVSLSIAGVPIFEVKQNFAADITMRYIPQIADRIKQVKPENKENLRGDISTIREFLVDILASGKNSNNE